MATDEKKREDFAVDIGDRKESDFEPAPSTRMPAAPIQVSTSLANNPVLSIVSYCGSSILMTVTNKYVLSGLDFNLNFLLLCVQNLVCVATIQGLKTVGLAQFRDFNKDEARKWFPVSLLLIGMIYTGSKAIQFLSIPVYTIFKNLTIILIAYGEVLWFGGSVSGLTLLSFGLIVFSSIVAAWADIQTALYSHGGATPEASDKIATLNAGYIWMLANCFCSASYILGMRKRIKLTNFKDFDTMFYNNLLTIPILVMASVLIEGWSSENLARNFPPEHRTPIILAIILSGLASVFISYTSAWCVRVTSSTTYSMVGALNKLPIALSGLVFFGDPATFGSVSAIALGFFAGCVYTVAKLNASSKPKESVLPTSNPVISASNRSAMESMKA